MHPTTTGLCTSLGLAGPHKLVLAGFAWTEGSGQTGQGVRGNFLKPHGVPSQQGGLAAGPFTLPGAGQGVCSPSHSLQVSAPPRASPAWSLVPGPWSLVPGPGQCSSGQEPGLQAAGQGPGPCSESLPGSTSCWLPHPHPHPHLEEPDPESSSADNRKGRPREHGVGGQSQTLWEKSRGSSSPWSGRCGPCPGLPGSRGSGGLACPQFFLPVTCPSGCHSDALCPAFNDPHS